MSMAPLDQFQPQGLVPMDASTIPEAPKQEPASCTECRRRKQKCDRKWPCNRCTQRRVPQLCNFTPRSAPSPPFRDASRGTKRTSDESGLMSSEAPEAEDEVDTDADIIAFGYMQPATHSNVEGPTPSDDSITSVYTGPMYEREVKRAIKIIPKRHLTDILVHHFLTHTNYFYYAVYPAQFLQDYSRWWSDKDEGQTVSPPFTALLIRVCAYSAQFLTTADKAIVEPELGDDAESLSLDFHDAAETLGRSFSPGKGGLMHVQQLFISASWYKAEGKFVESWHALASAIREAQEMGLHQDVLARRCSDFDMEMRRRMWCLLTVWDWLMSLWLSRPLLINHKSSQIEPPNLRMDSYNDYPSPFLPILLLYDMSIRLSRKTPDELKDLSNLLSEVQDWLDTFPACYKFDDPDKSRDVHHPYIKMQRGYLYVMANMFMMDPLKTCLTKTSFSETETLYRPLGVDVCLRQINTAQWLFEFFYPDSAKAYIMSCAAFDPACLLISALMHDHERSLPRRIEVIKAIESAACILKEIATKTKTAQTSHGILSRLMLGVPELRDQFMSGAGGNSAKRLKQGSINDSPHSSSAELSQQSLDGISNDTDDSSSFSPSNPAMNDARRQQEPALSPAASPPSQPQQPLPPTTFTPSVTDFENANFDGLEHIWNWQDLNLTVTGDGNALALFTPPDEGVFEPTTLDENTFGNGFPAPF